jgi:glutamate synthase (NADPH/NADH) large chain
MTGGVVWLYDADGERLHKESVRAVIATPEDLESLRALVEEHATETGSPRARALLADWDHAKLRFIKVIPAASEVQTVVSDPALLQISNKTR